MLSSMLLKGHRGAITGLAVLVLLATALSTAMIGTIIEAADRSNSLRGTEPMSTETVQAINELDGIANSNAMAAVVAVIVSMILLSSTVSTLVDSVSSTTHRLRLMGMSRRSVRLHTAVVAAGAGIIGAVLGLMVAPLIGWVLRKMLVAAGLGMHGVDSVRVADAGPMIAVVAIAWVLVSAWWASRSLGHLEYRAAGPSGRRRILALSGRAMVGLGAAVGVLAILNAGLTLENINEMTFGLALAILVVLWSVWPAVVWLISRLISPMGVGGLISSGLVRSYARRLSNVSLVGGIFLAIAGSSAILALASSTAGQARALQSLDAEAISDQPAPQPQGQVAVSAFDSDSGWLLSAEEASTASVLRVNPVEIQNLLADEVVTAGSLADIGPGTAAADESDYALGDQIAIHDNAGNTETLTLVALTDETMALRGNIVVDEQVFPVSAGDNIRHRTYAAAPGGLAEIQAIYLSLDWQINEDYMRADLQAGQSRQIASLISMIGGITLIALIALMHSVISFGRDIRALPPKMYRLSINRKKALGTFAAIGSIIGIGTVVFAAVAITVANKAVSDLLLTVGVSLGLALPLPVFAVAALLGLLLPTALLTATLARVPKIA